MQMRLERVARLSTPIVKGMPEGESLLVRSGGGEA